MIKKPDFTKINDTLWEISTSYKEGMNVPVRVYATKKILDSMDLAVFDQASNVATLPGIQKYSYVMPDGHSGYGFPIGGVAAFDLNEGVISPGGVGFDINCLVGDSEILTEHGYRLKIKDMVDGRIKVSLPVLTKKKAHNAEILLYLRRKARDDVYEITTETGHVIKATLDHPLLTPTGMKEIKHLEKDELIALYPFKGVEYTEPNDDEIISPELLREVMKKIGLSDQSIKSIMNELKKRNLHEIKRNSPLLSTLIKLLAYSIGNGTVYMTEKRVSSAFWGRREDLLTIKKDIEKLGFSANIYKRDRRHRISTRYGEVRFEITEYSLHVPARAFAVLLVALGCPIGNKANQVFQIPNWIKESPKWHKRLFLASYFGAEMSSPKEMNKHPYNFYMASVSVNKTSRFIESGLKFMYEIKEILSEFGIKSTIANPEKEYSGRHGDTYRIRLHVLSNPENLIQLYQTIGFEYNIEKTKRANAVIVYLLIKENMIKERTMIAQLAKEKYKSGTSTIQIIKEIMEETKGEYVNPRFVIRSIYEGRKTMPRILTKYNNFKEFYKDSTKNLNNGAVWVKIRNKEKVKYDGYVYDFTMNHHAHNFIANGFVVSNCGMRLVRTDLTFDEVKPKLKELIEKLFKKVPSGVGATGFVKISKDEFKKVVEEGSRWAVEHGYGWEEDLKRTEENGCMEGADVNKISQRAITRGYDQIGTLGSGNHYLEIQVVKEENIFDKEAAKKLGIFPNQVVVMFHCGSRGFGHQIATDSLNVFLNVMESKYKIKIRDKELACAPFNSPEGQTYFSAMKCGMNMAFANRQVILHRIREVFSEVFKSDPEKLGMHQIYDVTHNTAKVEKYLIDGNWKEVIVHRKGATRAFGPENQEMKGEYYKLGQPVIIGGSMETGSYLLLGTKKAEEETFGSTAHGSGRTMSRAQAKHQFRGDQLQKDMEKRGIIVKTDSLSGLAEEAGAAYKNIDDVVEAIDKAGISKKVVRFVPVANIKG